MGQLVVVGASSGIFGFGEAGAAILTVLLGLGTAVGGLGAPRMMVTISPRALPTAGAILAGGAFTIACLIAAGTETVVTPEGMAFADRARAVINADLIFFGICLFITGIGAGWWAVSCNTLLQRRADPSKRSLVYSGINIVTNMGIIGGFVLLFAAQIEIPEIMAGTLIGAATFLGGLIAAWYYRAEMLRWGVALLCRMVYKVILKTPENLPAEGGCVVVANHQSFADGLLCTMCLPRLCRPIMHASYAFKPIRSLFDLAGCITIEPGSGRPMLQAINAAVDAAKSGQVVLIFPEGKLSRACDLDKFQSGATRIASRGRCPHRSLAH